MKRKFLSILFALVLVVSFSLVTAAPVGAQETYYVSTDGSDDYGDGTETWVDNDLDEVWSEEDTGPWLTISYAINQAVNTDTINVAAGTYIEDVTIDKSVTLISHTGDYRTSEVTLDGKITCPGTASDITIQGFNFEVASGDSVESIWCPGTFGGNGFRILSNSFTADPPTSSFTSYAAIGIYPNFAVTGLVIDDNLVTGVWGIFANFNNAPAVSEVTITNNVVIGDPATPAFAGISVDTVEGVISENEISYTNDAGINVGFACSDLTISNNTVTHAGCGQWNNAGAINLYSECTNITITGNTLSHSWDGITIKDSYEGALGSGITVNLNNITGNSNYGVFNDADSGTLDAENNWWGSASGPTHASNTYTVPAGTPQGDTVSDLVDFVPWNDTDMMGTSFAPVKNITDEPDSLFSSIQAAIDAGTTDPGDTITVAAGTYKLKTSADKIWIKKDNLTVESTGGADVTFIDGSELTLPAGVHPILVRLEADGITFRGFTVQNPVPYPLKTPYNTPPVSISNASNCLFTQNIVTRTDGGVTSIMLAGDVVNNNTISYNKIRDSGKHGIVVCILSGGNKIVGNTITNCSTTGSESNPWNTGFGISVTDPYWNMDVPWSLPGTVISGNEISGGTRGIGILGCAGNATSPIVIQDNYIHGVITGKAIEHGVTTGETEGKGIEIYHSADVNIFRNRLEGNGKGIQVKGSNSTNIAANVNNITGNSKYGIEAWDDLWDAASVPPLVNAAVNWWGDASGPDGPQSFPPATFNGLLPGTGDRVSANVWCMPWLTRLFGTVLEHDIAYFGISSPALKGWNIVSAPLALDAHITTDGFTANTWGGFLNLGKAEGDDRALKLHYTVVEGVRDYTPIYYYDSDPASPDFGWRQATELTKVNPVDAYYIRMMESDSIPILFSPDLSVPSKKLYHGWNLVGCAYMDVMFGEEGQPIETALATIAKVSSPAGDVTGYAQVVSPPVNQPSWIFIPPDTYIPPEAVGEMILIGRGYWVFMENPGTLAGLTFTPISLP